MAKDDGSRIVVSGPKRTIEFAVRLDGTMPAKAFYDSLDDMDRDRLFSLFTHFANYGEATSGRFGPERTVPADINNGHGKLWAFKDKTFRRPGGGKGMFRISCFRIHNRWLLLWGFWKPPQSKWPETDFATSFAILHEALQLEAHRSNRKV
jgi:hypothetical protein